MTAFVTGVSPQASQSLPVQLFCFGPSQHRREDCDLLHAGVDEMRKNTNPFTGGLNFDVTWPQKHEVETAGREFLVLCWFAGRVATVFLFLFFVGKPCR